METDFVNFQTQDIQQHQNISDFKIIVVYVMSTTSELKNKTFHKSENMSQALLYFHQATKTIYFVCSFSFWNC